MRRRRDIGTPRIERSVPARGTHGVKSGAQEIGQQVSKGSDGCVSLPGAARSVDDEFARKGRTAARHHGQTDLVPGLADVSVRGRVEGFARARKDDEVHVGDRANVGVVVVFGVDVGEHAVVASREAGDHEVTDADVRTVAGEEEGRDSGFDHPVGELVDPAVSMLTDLARAFHRAHEPVDAVLPHHGDVGLHEDEREVGIDGLFARACDAVGRVGRLRDVGLVGVEEHEHLEFVAEFFPQAAVLVSNPSDHRHHMLWVGEVAEAREALARVHDHESDSCIGTNRVQREAGGEEAFEYLTIDGIHCGTPWQEGSGAIGMRATGVFCQRGESSAIGLICQSIQGGVVESDPGAIPN